MDIIFDLDGTLIEEESTMFYKILFGELLKRFNKKFGIDKDVFVPAMHKSMMAMEIVDGSDTIGNQFFKVLSTLIGVPVDAIEKEFGEFFDNDFDKVLVAFKPKPAMSKVVKKLKDRGDRLVIATDPFLPKVAVDKKIRYCGLNVEDFDFITYNSDCHFTKANPKFFEELFKGLHIDPENAIVIGNTVPTDVPAFPVRETYILQDSVKEKGTTTMPYTRISSEELLEIVESATSSNDEYSENE